MKLQLWPDREIKAAKRKVGAVPTLVLRPAKTAPIRVGVLWIHGGGYMTGSKEMVYMSRAMDLVKCFGATVFSPGYRLSWQKPYPAAVDDCYAVLAYMDAHRAELGFDRIMVGGESAGGGLCAAVCMMARDRGVRVAFQMPLYPMLSNFDTESSRDNHGIGWGTRRNHLGWRLYLRDGAKKQVSPYASPSRQTDYRGLPPCYLFVGDGEPFYTEALEYVEALRAAGVEASADVYPTKLHGFDILTPDREPAREAIKRFNARFRAEIERDGE